MFKNKKELPELTREIVKQHTGLNRSERRIHGRHRVRNGSLATCHPKQFSFLSNKYQQKAAKGLEITMSKGYKLIHEQNSNSTFKDKGMGLLRKILN